MFTVECPPGYDWPASDQAVQSLAASLWQICFWRFDMAENVRQHPQCYIAIVRTVFIYGSLELLINAIWYILGGWWIACSWYIKCASGTVQFLKQLTPWAGSESFGVHELILPEETRLELCRWLRRSQQRTIVDRRCDPNVGFGYRGWWRSSRCVLFRSAYSGVHPGAAMPLR